MEDPNCYAVSFKEPCMRSFHSAFFPSYDDACEFASFMSAQLDMVILYVGEYFTF